MSSPSSTRAAALAIRASTSVTAAPKAQARHAINGPVLSHTNHHRDTHQRSQNDDRSRRLFSTTSSRLQDQSYPSNISRREPNYPGHIPLNAFETGLMSVGSAIASLINPGRPGELFFCPCGELATSGRSEALLALTPDPFIQT